MKFRLEILIEKNQVQGVNNNHIASHNHMLFTFIISQSFLTFGSILTILNEKASHHFGV